MQKVAEKNYIKVGAGPVVVVPLKKWEQVEREAREYREKKKLSNNLKRFDDLAKWGRQFAKKSGITKKQILEYD